MKFFLTCRLVVVVKKLANTWQNCAQKQKPLWLLLVCVVLCYETKGWANSWQTNMRVIQFTLYDH